MKDVSNASPQIPGEGAYDVVVIGAGASGLMCAIHAGRRGLKVLVLEKGPKPGLKILVSGEGAVTLRTCGQSPRITICRRTNTSAFPPCDATRRGTSSIW